MPRRLRASEMPRETRARPLLRLKRDDSCSRIDERLRTTTECHFVHQEQRLRACQKLCMPATVVSTFIPLLPLLKISSSVRASRACCTSSGALEASRWFMCSCNGTMVQGYSIRRRSPRLLGGCCRLERSWGAARLLRACARLGRALKRRERLPRPDAIAAGSSGIWMDSTSGPAMHPQQGCSECCHNSL